MKRVENGAKRCTVAIEYVNFHMETKDMEEILPVLDNLSAIGIFQCNLVD